jgi:hypothetical protein
MWSQDFKEFVELLNLKDIFEILIKNEWNRDTHVIDISYEEGTIVLRLAKEE